MIRHVLTLLLAATCLPAQDLKLQLDRSPVRPLTFTLAHHMLVPPSIKLEKNTIYQICVRNGMFTGDLNFEIGQKGSKALAADSVKVKQSKSTNAYGFFRFTPGMYTLSVREHPEFTATIEVK